MLPEPHNFVNYPFKKEHQLVTNFLTDNAISCFDLVPFFSQYENPRQFWVAKDDAHYNKFAHELVAKYAFDFIAKKTK